MASLRRPAAESHPAASPRKRPATPRSRGIVQGHAQSIDRVGRLPDAVIEAAQTVGGAHGTVHGNGWVSVSVGAFIFAWEQPLLHADERSLEQPRHCYQLEGPSEGELGMGPDAFPLVSLAPAAAGAGTMELLAVWPLGVGRYWPDVRQHRRHFHVYLKPDRNEEPSALTRLSPGDYACGFSNGAVVRVMPAADSLWTLPGVSGGMINKGLSFISGVISGRTAAPADPIVSMVAALLPGAEGIVALLVMTTAALRFWRLTPPEVASTLAPAAVWEYDLTGGLQYNWTTEFKPKLLKLQALPQATGAADRLVLLTQAAAGEIAADEIALQLSTLRVPDLARSGGAGGGFGVGLFGQGNVEISDFVPLVIGSLRMRKDLKVTGLVAEAATSAESPEVVKVIVACEATVLTGHRDATAAIVTADVPLLAAGEMDDIDKLPQTLFQLPLSLLPGCVAAGAPPGGEGILLLSVAGDALWFRHFCYPRRRAPVAAAAAAVASTQSTSERQQQEAPPQQFSEERPPSPQPGPAPVDVDDVLAAADAAEVGRLAEALGRAFRLSASAGPAATVGQLVQLREGLAPFAAAASRGNAEAAVVAVSRGIIDALPGAAYGWASSPSAGGGSATTPAAGGETAAQHAEARTAAAAADVGERRLVHHVLEEKLRRHRALVAFLHNAGLWPQLKAARAALAEDGERLAAAAALCNLQAQTASRARSQVAAPPGRPSASEPLDPNGQTAALLRNAIATVLERRRVTRADLLRAGLTADDVYFSRLRAYSDKENAADGEREASKADAGIIEALLEVTAGRELLPEAVRRLRGSPAELAALLNCVTATAVGTLEEAEAFRAAEAEMYRCGVRVRPWTGVGAARRLLRKLLELYCNMLESVPCTGEAAAAAGAAANMPWRRETGGLVQRVARLLLTGFDAGRAGMDAGVVDGEAWRTEYEDAKVVSFECLVYCGLDNAAWRMAEKHLYFHGLVYLCDSDEACKASSGTDGGGGVSSGVSGGRQGLQRLLVTLRDVESTAGPGKTFPIYALEWFYKRKRFADLLEIGKWVPDRLVALLKHQREDRLLWVHGIGAGEYDLAAEALGREAAASTNMAKKRRELLSMAKLCRIAVEPEEAGGDDGGEGDGGGCGDGGGGGSSSVGDGSGAAVGEEEATLSLDAALRLAKAQGTFALGLGGGGNDAKAMHWRELVPVLVSTIGTTPDPDKAAAAAVSALAILEDVVAGSRTSAVATAAENEASALSSAVSVWAAVMRPTVASPQVGALVERADTNAPPTDPEVHEALKPSLLQAVADAVAKRGLRECGQPTLRKQAVSKMAAEEDAMGSQTALGRVLLRCPAQ